MRACLAVLFLVSGPAFAQGVPQELPRDLPRGLSTGDALAIFQTLTPQQRQMLAVGALRGRDSLSVADALAWYQSMTPQQKAQAKEWANQQGGNAGSLKDTAKRLLER